MEPTSPIALFNLGVMLAQSGKNEEGEAFIRRSVEVDPNYTYGQASIALTEADLGHEKEALDHLGFVTYADIIAPETAIIANLAWLVLAIRKNDLDTARQRYNMAAQIAPDHPLLERYKKLLTEAESLAKSFGFLIEYQKESAIRAHQRMLKIPLTTETDLLACLATNNKEMMVGTAHFLRVSSSGKKGELASRLAETLLDTEYLQVIVDELMEEREREALRKILEGGGVSPWKEFVKQFGDDREESIYWNYHEPESIPGRLRMSGLLYTGELKGEQVAFIPSDVRPILRDLLSRANTSGS